MKTALLVDDNDELRSATREYLEEMGYGVTSAADAEEALRVATESSAPGESFGLLASDVYMPGMNGIELADRLLSRQPELAVLLFSGRGGEPEIRRRLAQGDVAFMPKPFSPEELTSKVGEAFERASARRSSVPLEAVQATGVEARPAPAKPQPWLPKEAQVAGAIMLVLGLGALVRSFELGAPPLPAPVAGSATRSATIEVVQPLGPLAAAPAVLTWHPVDGASSYAVSLRAIDGTALWQAEVSGSPADVPPEVKAGLHRAVTYYWSVEALDAERQLVARSELSPFVIELASQPPPL